ncbi:hypothetical protein F4818DRAFT_446523 [Hypoxylon cercidicola]|nr:hypothetical protein F4818DRAFT_446523 [Hypoxylon cercidicola]
MTATGGGGVDMVLSPLSGSLLTATWSCIAPFGRIVEISKVDIAAARRLGTMPLGSCATFAGFDISQLNDHDHLGTSEALTGGLRIYLARVKSGKRGPVYPIEKYPISGTKRATKQIQRGHHIRKVVVVPHE